jgi:DNA-binding CsgD family transcriptional regulator
MTQATELLERHAELHRFEETIDRAREGVGGLLFVEGPAGIGKTSLLAAAKQLADERGMRTLAARSTEIEREFPYGAVRQLLEPALRAASPRQRREWLSGPATHVAAALGLAAGESLVEPGTSTLNALSWLLGNIAAERPCLVLMDDAQWADSDSLRFLSFLAPRLADQPLLAVVAVRSEEWEPVAGLAATASDPASRPLIPAPLSESATAQVVAARFAGDSDLGGACHAATGGNPFYLHALLDVIERERVPAADAAALALSLGPEMVTRAIMAQIGRLPPEAAVLARALAVLGDDSDLNQAALLAELTPQDVIVAADLLANASVLRRGRPLRFSHPILRNAVYADIGARERGMLHERAANLQRAGGASPERIAAHLLALDPAADAERVQILRAAASGALARGASRSAVAHLGRALAEPPVPGELGAVLFELGAAELTVDGSAAVANLSRALELASEDAGRASVARLLAVAHLTVGETEDSVAVLRAELDRLPAGSPLTRALEIDLVTSLAMGASPGQMAEAQARIERLAPTLRGDSVDERKALACLSYCRLCSGVSAVQAAEPAKRWLELRAPGEGLGQAAPNWLLAVGVLTRCDELDLAERLTQRSLVEATEVGLLYELSGGHWAAGTIAHFRGRLAEAAAAFEVALRGSREFGAVAGVHASALGLLEVRVERGELAAADALLVELGLETAAPAPTMAAVEFIEARAYLRLAQGSADAALSDLEEAAARARDRADLGPGISRWRSLEALARLRNGDREEAVRLAACEVERARRFGAARPLGSALRIAGLARGGEEGIGLLREAVVVLDQSPHRLEAARSLVELGAAVRRLGERVDARAFLARGLETARSCGAIPLVERAYEELRATGARPRKILYTGVAALTPSEARVARLAASGSSNREIGQELFVTVKTVEAHLGHIYRKLEIGSRTQLAEALESSAEGS